MTMKLYYFEHYGRAEHLRMLLWHAKAPYEDVTFSKEEFATTLKSDSTKYEFGQVPVLEVDGKFLNQSQAILRFLGKKFNYYPAEPEACWRVDSLQDGIEDMIASMVLVNSEIDPEKQKAALGKLLMETLPMMLTVFENRLK
jgi:glutathione S-transferase